jgi:uncharacterized membrane protein YfcA
MNTLLLLALGLLAGTAAGMFGIGGGLIIVPCLMLVMKMSAIDSIGTSLATIIIPANILGAIEYYRNGHVNIKAALLIAAGMLIGSYAGARLMLGLPPAIGKKIYGAFLLIFGIRYILFK